MPTPLTLVVNLPPDVQMDASNIIISRYLKPWGRLSVLLVPLAFALAFGLGIGRITGIALPDAILTTTYGFIGAVLGLVLMQRLNARRFARVLSTSALRTAPTELSLGDDGIAMQGHVFRWDSISGTSRWKDCTFVHFSALDALVIPDAALPAGETPETLAARIAEWKSL